ncbi:hypothetical protein [Kribbella sp. NPDC055071]
MSCLPPDGSAAPNYNQPPRRNRAGLIIVVLLLVLIAVLGAGGVVAYRLIADQVSSPDKSPAAAPTPDPATVAKQFVAQLNANNPTAAIALACEDSKNIMPGMIENYIGPPTKLAITGGPSPVVDIFEVPFAGTTKGTRVTGNVALNDYNGPFCVSELIIKFQ